MGGRLGSGGAGVRREPRKGPELPSEFARSCASEEVLPARKLEAKACGREAAEQEGSGEAGAGGETRAAGYTGDCAVEGRLGVYTKIGRYADFVLATAQVNSLSLSLSLSLFLGDGPATPHPLPPTSPSGAVPGSALSLSFSLPPPPLSPSLGVLACRGRTSLCASLPLSLSPVVCFPAVPFPRSILMRREGIEIWTAHMDR